MKAPNGINKLLIDEDITQYGDVRSAQEVMRLWELIGKWLGSSMVEGAPQEIFEFMQTTINQGKRSGRALQKKGRL